MKSTFVKALFIFFGIVSTHSGFSQAPNISYSPSTNVVSPGIPITITPTNIGGSIPANIYGQVTTIAGSTTGSTGYVNATGTSARFNRPGAVVGDASGNLYIGDSNNNSIRLVTPAGVVTTFAGSATGASGNTDATGTAARFNNPDGLALDASGNLFVADYGNNAIRKVTSAGVVTTFYHGTGTFGPAGICFDASGNLLVAAQDAMQIWKITSAGVVSTVAGSTAGYVNATGTAARFKNPNDVKVDAAGNTFVADYLNNAIRKISSAGVVTTLAGSNVAGNTGGFADGIGTAAKFNNPTGVALGGGGIVYVADFVNNNIRRILPDGTVNLIAGSPTQASGWADATGLAALFRQCDYLYIDGSGNGYEVELIGSNVRKIFLTGYTISGSLPAGLSFNSATGVISGTATTAITTQTYTVTAFNANGYAATTVTLAPVSAPVISYVPSSNNLITGVPFSISPTNTGGAVPATIYGQVTTLAGGGVLGYVDGTGTAARFNIPEAVAMDASGNLYIADTQNNAIRKVTPGGVVTTLAGSSTGAAGFTNGTGSAASFNQPDGVAIDASGNIFIGDQGNNAIRKITPAGIVTTFVSSGVSGPSGIRFDGSGNLIVAAQTATQILKITPAGVVSTIAGSTYGYVNSPTPTSAKFENPADVALDGAGNYYVADYLNNAVRKISGTGTVTTLAGSAISGNTGGFADGVGTAAKFNNLTGISIAPGGVSYVSDLLNNDIRRVMPDGTVQLIAGSASQASGAVNGTGTSATFFHPVAMYIDATATGYVMDARNGNIRKILFTGYSLSGTLPAGLNLDPTTGIISGTPTTPVTSQMATVLAFNSAGFSSTTVTFGINVPTSDFNWLGTVSSEWTNRANWSSATVPGLSDMAKIGLISFVNQPAVNSSVQVGNILFGGGIPVTVTVNSGGTLQVTNSMIQSHSADNTTPATTLTGNGSILTSSIIVGNSILPKVVNIKKTVFTSRVANLTVSDSLVITSGTIDLLSGGLATNNAVFSLEGGTMSVGGHITLDNLIPPYLLTVPSVKPVAKFMININSSQNATLLVGGASLFMIKHPGLDSIDFYHYTSGSGISTVSYQGGSQAVYTNNSAGVDTLPYTYQNLAISGTGNKLAGQSGANNKYSVGGNLTITGGTLDMKTNLAYATVYGNFSNRSTSAAILLGKPGINFKGVSFVNSGVFRDTSSTVFFSGSTQTLVDSTASGVGTNFDWVSFSNSGTKTIHYGKFAVIPKGRLNLSANAIVSVDATANLILKSDSSSTASVTAIPSGSKINGIVNAEWFVLGSPTSTLMRTYRLLSAPVNHTVKTDGTGDYNLKWLFGTTNYDGALIGGTSGTTNGFDFSGNPTIYIYREDVNYSGGSFISGNYRGVNQVNNTNINDIGTQKRLTTTAAADTTVRLHIGNGVFFFFRGNRVMSNGTTTGTKTTTPYNYPENVTFTNQGTVNQGQVQVKLYFRNDTLLSYTNSTSVSNGSVRGFNMVGNPYPSSINWDNMSTTDSTASIYAPGVSKTISFYNPVTKVFDTYTADATHNRNQVYPGMGAAASNIIPSGEGFLVRVDSTSSMKTSATLRFREAAKFNPPDTIHTLTMLALRSVKTTPKIKTLSGQLQVSLIRDRANRADEIIPLGNNLNSNVAMGHINYDPDGNNSPGVTVIAYSNDHKILKSLPLPTHSTSILLNVQARQSGNMELTFSQLEYVPAGFSLKLSDKLTGKSVDIWKKSTYAFKVNIHNHLTFGDRFRLTIIKRTK